MNDFAETIAPTVDDAVKAAGDCTRLWFDTMAAIVDGAVDQTTTTETLTKDLARLAAAGARDTARAMSAWITIGQAIAGLDLPRRPQDGPPDAAP